MTSNYFITGTDTNVGKTYISICLLKAFSNAGFQTLGIKPISAGGDDAIKLQQASSIRLPLAIINPFDFKQAIAPHIAAEINSVKLSVAELIKKTESALNHPADIRFIEGAGGLRVPLNQHETMADFVKQLNIPIILVVGIRLGCINHAILTHEAILHSGLTCVGWIANCVVGRVNEKDAIIATLQQWIKAPYLVEVPYQANTEKIGAELLSKLNPGNNMWMPAKSTLA